MQPVQKARTPTQIYRLHLTHKTCSTSRLFASSLTCCGSIILGIRNGKNYFLLYIYFPIYDSLTEAQVKMIVYPRKTFSNAAFQCDLQLIISKDLENDSSIATCLDFYFVILKQVQ